MPTVSETEGGGRKAAPERPRLRFEDKVLDEEQGIFGTLVWIDGTAAGWIFEDRRDGSFDVTLTRLGEADKDIRSCFTRHMRKGGTGRK